MAATVVPLLILAMAEVGLRVAGVGYPTDFFIKATIDGQAFWIENSKFGWRFFPRQMARTPTAQTLPLKKTEDTIRIFVFGESAAEGDPAPAYGFARILQVLLEERHPEKRFEVVNVAVTAINSHAIRSIARQSSRLEGDFWVVYAGHNEVIGSFGPATVFGAKPPSLGLIRAALFLKSTKIGQLVDQALQPSAAGEGWGGMEMFLDQQIHPDDPRLKAVYSNFQRNLEAIVRAGERSGARVLVSNMPGNLRDCAPFASLNAPGLAEPRLAAWKQLYERGVHLEEDRRMAEAIEAYLEAAEIDPTYAELQFRLGRCYLALNRPAQARDSFQRALDADTLRFRTDSRLNEIIAKVAERTGGRVG